MVTCLFYKIHIIEIKQWYVVYTVQKVSFFKLHLDWHDYATCVLSDIPLSQTRIGGLQVNGWNRSKS